MAIEKDGRIGLQQRNPSEASSISGRKLSEGTETTEAASSVQLDNSSTNISSETTSQSEAPRPLVGLASGPPKGLAESPQIKENPAGKKSDYGSHERKADHGQGAGDQAPAAPKETPAPEPALKEAPAPAPAPTEAAPAPAPAPAGVDANKTNGVKTLGTPAKSTPGAAPATAPRAGTGGDVNKTNGVKALQTPGDNTPATSVGAQATGRRAPAEPAEAPVAVKPTGPGRLGRPAGAPGPAAPPTKAASKQAPEPAAQPKPASKPTNAVSQPPTTPKAANPSNEKKTAPVSASPGGFVKPRPKSPTRPVQLPPSLTTHTTASGSRTRTAGSAPPSSHENSARSTSRSKALGRSSSAAGRQRPSLGPPPKQPAKDHPVVKKDAKVDEGFLARMMRPTQASASKKNEKVPITPPRRPAAAPKKSASAKSGITKRPVSKTTSATTSAAPSPERTREASADIATVIERMSVAENIQETPKTPEREDTILEELEEEKSGVAPESSNEPEVEEAAVPLANGKTEQAASQPADTGAEPEEETW